MIDSINIELERANLGADFEEFCGGNVGSHLIKCAERDELAALRKLANVDSGDKETIYKLQLAAKAPRMAINWIGQTISEGKTAKHIVDQESETY